jgi:hypothetical protein
MVCKWLSWSLFWVFNKFVPSVDWVNQPTTQFSTLLHQCSKRCSVCSIRVVPPTPECRLFDMLLQLRIPLEDRTRDIQQSVATVTYAYDVLYIRPHQSTVATYAAAASTALPSCLLGGHPSIADMSRAHCRIFSSAKWCETFSENLRLQVF